jgi:hypothetical protein
MSEQDGISIPDRTLRLDIDSIFDLIQTIPESVLLDINREKLRKFTLESLEYQ